MFYIRGNNADEETNVVHFDGWQEFCTECCECGQEVNLPIEEFLDIAREDLYGTQVICETCTKRRRTLRALD